MPTYDIPQLLDLITQNVTQHSSTDRITGAEMREVLTAMVTYLGYDLPEEVVSDGNPVTYNIQPGVLLTYVLLKANNDTTVACETPANPGSGDIIPAEDMSTEQGAVWLISKAAWDEAVGIVITGMPAFSKLYFVTKRFIPVVL